MSKTREKRFTESYYQLPFMRLTHEEPGITELDTIDARKRRTA